MPKLSERRYDLNGELRLMAKADGYVMVRHPGAMPFVLPLKVWDRLPTTKPEPPVYGALGPMAGRYPG